MVFVFHAVEKVDQVDDEAGVLELEPELVLEAQTDELVGTTELELALELADEDHTELVDEDQTLLTDVDEDVGTDHAVEDDEAQVFLEEVDEATQVLDDVELWY